MLLKGDVYKRQVLSRSSSRSATFGLSGSDCFPFIVAMRFPHVARRAVGLTVVM